MAGRSNDYVLDELLCFLSNPLFQVPVLSFMENHCLIFDASTEDSAEYREIQDQYRKLVDSLLEAFRSDTGLTHDQIIKAMRDLNAKPELRKVFQELFEQVLAMDDFATFLHLMINKNLELQKQALLLITMVHGQLPSSLTEGGNPPAQPPGPLPAPTQDEDEVLRAVLEQSKQEYEAQQRRSRAEEEEMRAVLTISQAENQRLEQASRQEQDKLSKVLQAVQLTDDPAVGSRQSAGQQPAPKGLASMGALPSLPKDAKKGPPASTPTPAPAPAPAPTPKTSKGPAPLLARHDVGGAPVKGRSGQEAAADWLKEAEAEVKSSDAHSKAVYAAAANMAGLSQEEYGQRVNFLRQQRDKLMEMKRREREKQLLSAAATQPARPASARAARNALSQAPPTDTPATPSDDDKKLAMRKAIASRIKSELMEDQSS